MMDKKSLRREKLKQRDDLAPDLHKAYSEQIIKSLSAQAEVSEAGAVLCYVNYKSEVSTLSFISFCLEHGKKVYCPRVLSGTEMEFYEISSLAELDMETDRPGAGSGLSKSAARHPAGKYYAIPEPQAQDGRRYAYKDGDCIILPGAVFSADGGRIGYGKGYYDRYLEKHPDLKTVGICFSCQMTEKIPAEPTDRKVDKIITENGVYTIV